ncbi:TPA: alpha-L-fucosidase, partial [Elizabethkingia anophelis]
MPPLSVFNPSSLNTDQWLSAAKSAGAQYAVLVVKHGSGFSLWPTKAHTYNVSNTPWKNGRGD